jgi:hypothetical protein
MHRNKKTSRPLPPAREADVAFPTLAASGRCRNPDHCKGSQHAVGGFSSPLHVHALRALIQEGTHMTNLKLSRHQFLHLAAGAAALPTVSRIARAQVYPTRPVRMIVGWAPGGGADIVARLIGQWLSDKLRQSFLIDNRPGASKARLKRGPLDPGIAAGFNIRVASTWPDCAKAAATRIPRRARRVQWPGQDETEVRSPRLVRLGGLINPATIPVTAHYGPGRR